MFATCGKASAGARGHFPAARRRSGSRLSTGRASASRPEKPSPLSASPAAAKPRSRACCSASSSQIPGRSTSPAKVSWPPAAPDCAPCAARCRWSFKTPLRRSIRGCASGKSSQSRLRSTSGRFHTGNAGIPPHSCWRESASGPTRSIAIPTSSPAASASASALRGL